MEIKVTFRFEASDSLLTCVDNFRKAMVAMASTGGLANLPANGNGIVKAIATEDSVTMKKKEQIWPPVEATTEKPEETATEAPKSDGWVTAQPTDETPAEPKETATATSVSDMRAAVNSLRNRIEGANWEDKTSEGYKQWHKKVTAAVKGIVSFCGGSKIPDIPEENRDTFIQKVAELDVVGDEVKPNIPF